MDLEGNNVLEQDVDLLGDQPTPKHPDLIRIAFQNINLLPRRSHHNKNKHLFTSLKHYNIDIFCCCETGLCWQLLPPEDQWSERARPYFRRYRTTISNNTTELDISKPRQFGGTAIIATDDTAHRVTNTGRDPTHLGRWSWITIQGSQAKIRIVSAYRPVHGLGPESVWAQHERILSKTNPTDPRENLLNSLQSLIQPWIDQGDQVILCMDANEDVRSNRIHQFTSILGLQDAILTQHPNPPATCDKNNNRQPIDAIWVTPGLLPVLSGYLPFDEGCPSDHRLIWIDIVKDTFLGNSSKLATPKPRRLKASDPRIVEKYNHLLLNEITTHNLLLRLRSIQSRAKQTGWTQPLEDEYNSINTIQLNLRKKIEKKIRKLRTGGKPWPPTLQKQRDTIWAISLLIKKRNRRQVSNRLIRRTLQKPTSSVHIPKPLPNSMKCLMKLSLHTNNPMPNSFAMNFYPR